VAAPDAAARPEGANAGVFLGTFALILLAMAGLFAVDLFLAGQERAERRSEARHFYIEGVQAAQAGKRSQAVDRFQSALSAERSNPLYQRSVAEAMLEEGKVAEARSEAEARLQQEPTDAAASLLVARALVREGEPREAVSYYHRAIYGQWDQNAAGNRMTSRFELIELLARLGAQRELLAELLPLQDEAPADLATRRRIAHLFLDAGAPGRASEIYRDLLRRHKGDAESYAGLGEAELARGNYRSAQGDFAQAAKLAPADSSISRRLELAERVIELDPTRRGLSAEERHRRSIELLRLTLQASDSCLAADSSGMNRAVLDSARAAMEPKRPAPPIRQNLADRNLDLAERLWDLRREQCPALPAEGAVALVLERVSQ
jgi:tetratricopeptide (TPR) repeat protein